jgi:nitroreductase
MVITDENIRPVIGD